MTKFDFIQTIRQLIADGNAEEALSLFRTEIPTFDPAMQTDATLLESRFQTAKTDFSIKNVIERDAYDVVNNQVKAAVLLLMDKLEKADPLSNKRVNGRLLHNIPPKMPVARETRCIVRIAYDDIALLKDMKQDDNIVIDDIRISEVMNVELVDFNETPAFQIRPFTDAEQFIMNDDYTQWLFGVKPLKEGTFPLTLKVAIMLKINGENRKKDIVIEKEVIIVSELSPLQTENKDKVAATSAFEDTNVRLNYTLTSDNGTIAGGEAPAGKRFSVSTVMSAFAAIVVALTGLYIANNQTKTKDMSQNSPSTADANGGKGKGKSNNNGENGKDTFHVEATKTIEPPKQFTDINDNKNDTSLNKGNNTPQPPVKLKPKAPKMVVTPPKKKPKPRIKPNNGITDVVPEQQPQTSENVIVVPNVSTPSNIDTKSNVKEVRTFKVRLILKGEMKKAEILVDGQPVTVLKRNMWGTPKSISFQSSKLRHSITFIYDGVSCTTDNILIEDENSTLEGCQPNKKVKKDDGN